MPSTAIRRFHFLSRYYGTVGQAQLTLALQGSAVHARVPVLQHL